MLDLMRQLQAKPSVEATEERSRTWVKIGDCKKSNVAPNRASGVEPSSTQMEGLKGKEVKG